MRTLHRFAVICLTAALPSSPQAVAERTATINKADLAGRFLMQTNYLQESGRQDFRTSRSRIVALQRDGSVLRMVDDSDSRAHAPRRVLATIPIRNETYSTVEVDLNAGFDTVSLEEDRTGEDYYGRIERNDPDRFGLRERRPLSVSYHDNTVVFDQEALTKDGERIVLHYYLTPYHPAPEFQLFEMQSLRLFGFYETYPQWRSDRWVLYAMKFDAHEPIVFALSSAIPARHRTAMQDGALYWNRAFGRPLVRVIDAPPGIHAPSPDYNVIQWVTSGEFASTSYIQSDPLTGQILHAHIFVLPEMMTDGNLQEQNDHLRYIVAHEVGHALGLRHNFAPGRVTSVMGYFKRPQILRIGRDIRAGAPALPYDAAVMRHVYLGAPLDLDALPPFCTDSQRGCRPFRSMPKEIEGMRGDPGRAVPAR